MRRRRRRRHLSWNVPIHLELRRNVEVPLELLGGCELLRHHLSRISIELPRLIVILRQIKWN
jgi:hypothetical protein